MRTAKVLLATLAITIISLLMTSCGGGGGSNAASTASNSLSVTLAPATASVTAGNTQQFKATVTGSTNTAVTWSVNGATGGDPTVGTISATGLYSAPSAVPSPATVTVVATSQADPTKSASATVTITAAPMPTASLSPSSLDFGSVNVGTNVTKTVTLTNTGSGTLDISGITIAGTNASDFTQTNNCGASLAAGASCNVVVDFAPSASGTLTASLTVTDNAANSPQAVPLSGTGVVATLTINPTSATVLLGAKQLFTLNADATANSALFGSMPVTSSGSTFTATYTVPQALPSAWNDTLTGTATAGGSQASAQITLQYPVPVITGTSALGGSLGTLWAPQPGYGPMFSITGSGFTSDLNLNVLNDPANVCGLAQVGWSEVQIDYALSYSDFGTQCGTGNSQATWDPGFIGFTINDPTTGHGGGTSNIGRLAFLGTPKLMAFNSMDAFVADPAKNTVHKYKIVDGSPDGSFTVASGTILAIDVDDTTGEIVVFTDTSVEAFDPITNVKVYELDAASPGTLYGGAAGAGWAVLSSYDGTQGFPNVMDAVNLQQPPGPAVSVHVKGTPQNSPWNFQIVNLNGTPIEVVWSSYQGVLSTVNIATQTVINSVALSNLFTFSQTGYLSRGGWQLEVFNTGPLAGTAVLLSNYDQVLVYVDLNTMQEVRRVDLTAPFTNANPPQPVLQAFRIGKDEADGSVVVAFADPVNGKTVLYDVDTSGNMTPLTATAPFLATGLQESADGTQIYWGNRSSFAITPKQ